LILVIFIEALILIQITTYFNSSNDQADYTISKTSGLDSWVGNYSYSECNEPDQNMFYEIEIYKDNSIYYARMYVDGFQTMMRMKAKVMGNERTIKLVFDSYLKDNTYDTYSKGDILLRLKRDGETLYTTWEKIQPINKKLGNIYITQLSQLKFPNKA
jgi:hypothetical protein